MSALSNQLEAKRSTSQWTHQIFAEKSINTSQNKTFLKDDHSNCTHKSKGGQCTRSTNKKSLSYEGQTLERKRNTAWTINDQRQQKRENSTNKKNSTFVHCPLTDITSPTVHPNVPRDTRLKELRQHSLCRTCNTSSWHNWIMRS